MNFTFYDTGFKLTFLTDDVLTTGGFFSPDLRICSYTFNVHVFLFIWDETNAQEKSLWLVLLVSIHAYWNEMWIWQDWGPEEQKGRVDAHWESGHLVWNAKVHCLCWEKAESKTPSFVKELKKGPASCQTGEKTHTAVAEQGVLSFTLSLSQACVCAGRVRWASSVLAFGRVKEK